MPDLFDLMGPPVARTDGRPAPTAAPAAPGSPAPAAPPPAAVLFDAECGEACRRRPASLVSWWLMSSYCYYLLDDPILSDAMFDRISREIAARWDEIDHPHKHLLGGPDEVHTGHHLAQDDYPPRVWHAICALRGQEWAKRCSVAYRRRK